MLSLHLYSLPLTFLPVVDGVEEEEEVGAWLRRCSMKSTQEEDEEMGGQIGEGRDGGREEGSSEGGSEGGAAPPPMRLCGVGRREGRKEGSNMKQSKE